MKEELIKKMEDLLSRSSQNSIHSMLLLLMMDMIRKLKPVVNINKFEVVDSFVSIELLHRDILEYVDIEVAKSNIEMRGDGYEMIYFFDSKYFKSKYTNLLTSFFKGEYTVASYMGKDGKKEAFGIIWNDKNLDCFNNEKEEVGFFRGLVTTKVSKDGLSWVD